DWDLVIDVNLKGVFLCTKAVAGHMMQRRTGRIINLSSIAGKRGSAITSAYCTSKFGVIGFTQSMAAELAGANVTVNAICPGEVDTHMWRDILSPAIAAATGATVAEAFDGFIKQRVPLGRPQTAEDMGQAAVYLCKADNVTGIALNVNGGTEMH
ncbi:MAG TPA: SDR family NAD(P)-dependent oxidoreductase, partial [Dehalococcoidia bacterium]|nr:SDR family NAD(P)-dependent oxidoreductase [Dehalococcoidia bacterium]